MSDLNPDPLRGRREGARLAGDAGPLAARVRHPQPQRARRDQHGRRGLRGGVVDYLPEHPPRPRVRVALLDRGLLHPQEP